MEDLQKLLTDLGLPPWLIIVAVALIFMRTTKPGGNLLDGLLDAIRKLMNRSQPDAKLELESPQDCCAAVIEMALHLDGHGETKAADALREALPRLMKGHSHAEETT